MLRANFGSTLQACKLQTRKLVVLSGVPEAAVCCLELSVPFPKEFGIGLGKVRERFGNVWKAFGEALRLITEATIAKQLGSLGSAMLPGRYTPYGKQPDKTNKRMHPD